LCVIRTLCTDNRRATSRPVLAMHTGSATVPLPSPGARGFSYGLGTPLNRNLPPLRRARGKHLPYARASQVWDSNFLPPAQPGRSAWCPAHAPIADIDFARPASVTLQETGGG